MQSLVRFSASKPYKPSKWQAFRSNIIVSFVAVLILELCEAVLEDLIAFGASWFITKTLSVVFAVTLTQSVKTLLKRLIKIITYKKGDDKMQYVRTFFKKLATQFKTNPVTITGSVITFPAFGVVSIGLIAILNHFGVQLPEWAIYTISGVASAIMACLVEWGIVANGWETEAEKALRLENKAKAKEEKQIALEAQKQLEIEQAEEARLLAEAQAQLEREAQEQAEIEKAKQAEEAQKAHQALVQAKVAELKLKARLNK